MKIRRLIKVIFILGGLSLTYAYLTGIPIHVTAEPYFSGGFKLNNFRAFMAGTTEVLTTMDIPPGRLGQIPILVEKNSLQAADGVINFVGALSFTMVLMFFCLLLGIAALFVGKLWESFLLLLAIPIVPLVIPAYLFIGSIPAHGTPAFYLIAVPAGLILAAPFLFLLFMLLGLTGLFGSAAGGGGGSSGEGAEARTAGHKPKRGSSGGNLQEATNLGWVDSDIRINQDTGVVETRGPLGWIETDQRIDLNTGVHQVRVGLGWVDSEVRTNLDTGIEQVRTGPFGLWQDTDKRTHPQSGVIQKGGVFGWIDTLKRIKKK